MCRSPEKAVIRVNVLGEDGRSWRDYSDRTHHAITLAALYQPAANTQVRVEGERGRRQFNVFSPTVSDGISYWDGVYTFDGSNALTGAAATAAGVTRINAVRNVWIPAVPQAGYSNWQNSFRTAGPGLALLPYPRESVAHSAVLPSREFTAAPTDVKSDQRYESLTAFLDHRFTESLHGQVAYYYYTLENKARSHVTLGSANIDLNQTLPNGAPNPKVGVPFSEVTPRRLNPYNEISEVRGLFTYRKQLPNVFDLDQRLTAIAGARRETFKNTTADLRQVAGPNQNPNFNAADMTVFYRYYEALDCMRRGLTNSQIGLALGISEHTAKAHVRSILEKLESGDRAEAVARGFERGMLHVD
jgi:DNA-binding CsgD family transcriptional regulator